MLPTFSQNLTLEEAFEAIAQINEELKNRIPWCILQKSQTSNQ